MIRKRNRGALASLEKCVLSEEKAYETVKRGGRSIGRLLYQSLIDLRGAKTYKYLSGMVDHVRAEFEIGRAHV